MGKKRENRPPARQPPLVVEKAMTGHIAGESHYKRKLSWELVKAIYELHDVQGVGYQRIQQWLEEVHGVRVTRWTVRDVCVRRTWARRTYQVPVKSKRETPKRP